MVEQMPEFPGGQDSLLMFLGRHVKYPEEAIRNKQEGTSYISFVVNSTGQIAEPAVLKSAAPSLDAEAIRVVNSMPVWKAGRQDGVAVAVKYVVPFRFKLPVDQPASEPDIQAKEPFPFVETYPKFPGGDAAMMRFLAKNVKYPLNAQRNGIEGFSVVSFVVKADGSLTDFKVLKSLGYGIDEEALRVVKAMPNWTPGTQNGKPVDVLFKLPIRFSTR